METERRSTLASLKGQLAEVNTSVKSMKATVVVGSVLTVACLAAVFGVTLLANEVSKETKVLNGQLVDRQGNVVSNEVEIDPSRYEALKGSVIAKQLRYSGQSELVTPVVSVQTNEDGITIARGVDFAVLSRAGEEDESIIVWKESVADVLESESVQTRRLLFSGSACRGGTVQEAIAAVANAVETGAGAGETLVEHYGDESTKGLQKFANGVGKIAKGVGTAASHGVDAVNGNFDAGSFVAEGAGSTGGSMALGGIGMAICGPLCALVGSILGGMGGGALGGAAANKGHSGKQRGSGKKWNPYGMKGALYGIAVSCN